jgi:hypothetical protein
VQLAFDPAKPTAQAGALREKDKVQIRIPLLVSGIAKDSAVAVNGTMVEIDAPGELHWNSGWNGSYSFLLSTQPYSDTSFAVDKVFFEQVKSTSAKVHISFALAAFRAKEVRRISAGADEFAVPGEALCAIYTENPSELKCRSPMKSPFLVVTTLSEETTCPLGGDEKSAPTGTTFSALNWNGHEFGISPVRPFSLGLFHWSRTNENFRARLCPGTPLTFSILEEVKRMRGELTIDGLRLADYQLKR